MYTNHGRRPQRGAKMAMVYSSKPEYSKKSAIALKVRRQAVRASAAARRQRYAYEPGRQRRHAEPNQTRKPGTAACRAYRQQYGSGTQVSVLRF